MPNNKINPTSPVSELDNNLQQEFKQNRNHASIEEAELFAELSISSKEKNQVQKESEILSLQDVQKQIIESIIRSGFNREIERIKEIAKENKS